MDFNAIRSTVAADFDGVNTLILKELQTEVPLIHEIGQHLIDNGGKRLRPLVSLLAARLCGYTGVQHLNVAAVVEFLHTATLLHDDVVDSSDLRRGKATANIIWGNPASVLVGDFLISRSFQMIVRVGDLRVLQILADATNLISEGEVLQLINCKDPATTEESYFKVIHHKTAKIFEAAAQMGAVLAGRPPEEEAALAKYAIHFGCAFQIIDDVLDYTGDALQMGKNVGDDLAEGKPTLPLIYAIKNGSPAQSKLITDAIKTGGIENLEAISQAVLDAGGVAHSMQVAQREAQHAVNALAIFPPSIYKEALVALAQFAVERNT
jgi:octaprenyl-diphosphate synthase